MFPAVTAGTNVISPEARVVATAPRAAGVPWYIWAGVLAVTSSSIGGAWDVSWHRSIGRDTFWTPAHMMIYACGVLAGVVGMWLAVRSTFSSDAELRSQSVSVFGIHAPLGVFLAAWGGLAMLTSAPFDNWWHNAYGLDVKIVSPPHALLILGVRAVGVGMLFLILAAMNRTNAETQPGVPNSDFRMLQILFLYVCGLMVDGQMFFLQEYTWDVILHQAQAYIAMAIGVPVLFALIWQSSRFKWAATTTAGLYMLFVIAQILILPLVPAEPKLGPVFNPVTHLVPAKFPMLLIVPALALDLLWQRTRQWKPWLIAVVSGVVFVGLLVVVEWPFAKFLMSHASQNRFFGTIYFDYNERPNGFDRMRLFFHPEYGWPLIRGLFVACGCAIASTWVGLGFGKWMRGVQR